MNCSNEISKFPTTECAKPNKVLQKIVFNPETKEVFADDILIGVNGELNEDRTQLNYESI